MLGTISACLGSQVNSFQVAIRSWQRQRERRHVGLTDAEMRVLDELSVRKDITKTAVLRQALRLYQTIDARVEKGEKLLFENEATKEKAELMLL